VLEVEVIGAGAVSESGPSFSVVQELTALALGSAGVQDGHVAVSFVEEEEMQEINREHRGRDEPTDVLSFPVDGADAAPAGPRELGDVVICPPVTEDLRAAVLHGVLHLTGMDHESDEGEMLALQAELMRWVSDGR